MAQGFLRRLFLILLFFSTGYTFQNAQEETLDSILGANDDLATFASLLTQVGLASEWQAQTPITVFAPTNEAFAVFPPIVIDYLTNNPETLERILNFHVVEGSFTGEDVFNEEALVSLESGVLVVNGDSNTINSAQVIEPDITGQGVTLHIIDAVMLPQIELPPADPLISFDDIITAGSSTVRPLTDRMKAVFEQEGFSGNIVVAETGTNVGLERFCVNTETDIANASRPIREEEIAACRNNGIEPIEFFVAIDALAITVSQDNTFVDNLTREQLALIFSGEVTTWNALNADWPETPIQTLSPGADSGTLVYFVDEIFDGEREVILNSGTIQFSEDDNVLVTAVTESPNSIGYFGFAYFIENQELLRVVDIEGVTPEARSAESGEYPLSRPLFIYTSAGIMQEKPQVAEFVKFYIENAASELGTGDDEIGYFPVNSDILNLNRLKWLAAMAGNP